MLTPRLLFDMGFPTPSAGGGWLGRQYDPFPVARNRMMPKRPPSGTASCRVLARWLFPRTFRNRVWPRGGTCWDPSTVPSPPPARRGGPHSAGPPGQGSRPDPLPECQSAFDLSKEPAPVHDRYGRFEMGQVMLLARRLVESGVRFVTANAVSNPQKHPPVLLPDLGHPLRPLPALQRHVAARI
ncbi:MAG: hypothetical protein CM1200mP2_26710 [Planctomycetaceae bacterium]|nr:MAG: hypothetical protein CM1200mP2_26710 [Planctomycetaceae bacterium]